MVFLYVFFNLMLALSLSVTWISAIVPIIAHSVVSKLSENTECVAPYRQELGNDGVREAERSMGSNDISAHVYERVISIISKPPHRRTDLEIGQILSWFKKKSDLFRQLKDGKQKT